AVVASTGTIVGAVQVRPAPHGAAAARRRQMFTPCARGVHGAARRSNSRGVGLPSMRDTYHDALDSVTDELVPMSRLVASMMERASAALLEVDREKAEAVIEADEEIDAINQEVELSTTELIALQQPVATDLRIVISSMRISTTLERMGDLAQHVAKT